MSQKKRTTSKGSRVRKYEVETLNATSVKLGLVSASQDDPMQEYAVSPRGIWYSTELIQHLIDRIKSL